MHPAKRTVMTTGSRSVTYSCASSRSTGKKKAISTQTGKDAAPFVEMFKSDVNPKEDFVFDQDMQTGYCLALNYINNIHRFMNKKLYESYGDCGDTNPEADSIFKLPDVPNYASIFLMLLEKSKPPDLSVHLPVKKDRVSDVKKLTDKSTKNSILSPRANARETQKNSNNIKSNNVKEKIIASDTHNRCGSIKDESNRSYKRKTDLHSTNDRIIEEEYAEESNLEDEMVIINKEETNCDSPKSTSYGAGNNEDYKSNAHNDINLEGQDIDDLIKKRVQEEFMTYLDKTNQKQTRLVSSSHDGVDIQPQLNLLEYAQKKLERQNCEPRSCYNVDDTPRRVTDMFQRFSVEDDNNDSRPDTADTETPGIFNNRIDESDNDSVILDDEEFERLHQGHYRHENMQERGLYSTLEVTTAQRRLLQDKHYFFEVEEDGGVLCISDREYSVLIQENDD